MLVVSNIDLTKNVQTIKPSTFLKSSIKDFTLNLNNDYRYLKTGYYVSVHAEVLGSKVLPSTEDIIDAYRTPIMLLKATKAGIPTLPYLVTGSVKQILGEFRFPMIIFAVNPFSFEGFKTAKNRSALYKAVKSLSMNYKFAVCVQPLLGEMFVVKSIFGRCACNAELDMLSKKIYETLRIPICKLHVQRVEQKTYLCALQPLKKEELLPDDIELISKEISEMPRRDDLYWQG
ncbi:RimK-like ATPgrasp N-terminal domain-containing protein [Candidatus Bathyarchaeota archaeon]|nr:RimK-like ATPgrasp N-terminal domain-containing protein [Candidatus Bathyarchaeota archaeon]